MKGDLYLIRDKFDEIMGRLGQDARSKLYRLVCELWDYCNKRKSYKETVNGTVMVAEIITQILDLLNLIPELACKLKETIGSVAFWMTGVIFGYFDDLCGCSKEGLAA